MARKYIETTIKVLVEDDREGEIVKKSLEKYCFIGTGVISLDKDLSRNDILITQATKNFIKRLP